MQLQENKSLKAYNTFGIEAKARYFLEINSIAELEEALQLKKFNTPFVISGGSNMLLTKDIETLVLHINLKGIVIVSENEDSVILKVMAGENWHSLVLWTLERDYGGLENMSLIPGNTGTAPIQNIGAYGVEIKDSFESCEAMNMHDQQLQTFSKEACQFGYRNSFFKNEGKGKFIITSVNLRLTKKNHLLRTEYGAITEALKRNKVTEVTIKDISEAVIAIRQQKLPDPNVLGNSGSFFKNPIISEQAFQTFNAEYPRAPFYKVSDSEYKIPAGWLIEQCGFKGKRFGDAGVHKNQALVLVNYGAATGSELLALAERIMAAVFQQFQISIVPEVNII